MEFEFPVFAGCRLGFKGEQESNLTFLIAVITTASRSQGNMPTTTSARTARKCGLQNHLRPASGSCTSHCLTGWDCSIKMPPVLKFFPAIGTVSPKRIAKQNSVMFLTATYITASIEKSWACFRITEISLFTCRSMGYRLPLWVTMRLLLLSSWTSTFPPRSDTR